jgi:hypothetical protein
MTTDDNGFLEKTSQKYSCEFCDYYTCKKANYIIHCETIKHKNNATTTDDNGKLATFFDTNIFICEMCSYKTNKKSNYENHCNTQKHAARFNQKSSQSIETSQKKSQKSSHNKNEKKHMCDNCNKNFNDRAGLWRHKKKCTNIEYENKSTITNDENKNIVITNLLEHFMKENSELKSFMIQQQTALMEHQNMVITLCKNNTTHNTNNIYTNSNNKTFNLNMFLNETCKNAMNISDFANSIQLQLSDLEDVGELGYVNGISNIIIKNLKELDITQRPIHCTDAKREILYIKDADKWEKENDKKDKIINFVKNIANKNIKMLNEFKKIYPDCVKYESKKSDHYNKFVIEAMGGSGNNDDEKYDKIIKKISKEVTIDKETL